MLGLETDTLFSHVHLPFEVPGHNPVSITVDVNANSGPAAFALGVRKSGSSLFANLVSAISKAAGRHVVDIPAAAFSQNIPYRHWCKPGPLKNLVWRSNVYVGFRDAPTGLYNDPIFKEAKKILLVRDPRDVLVSEYFSNAFSHSLPSENPDGSVIARERSAALDKGLETYVMERVRAINETMLGYRPLLDSDKIKVMRYEDVIFNKPQWLKDIGQTLEIDVPDQLIKDIMHWADIVPKEENSKEFVRRVKPGDHLEKLSTQAIHDLDDQLASIWRDLGYSKHSTA